MTVLVFGRISHTVEGSPGERVEHGVVVVFKWLVIEVGLVVEFL